MNELKPYLVDVPVRVNIWIRPNCQRKQFEVLKKARPSILFLISDGGRNQKEWDAINQNRQIFDNEIDWECTVYKIYEDKNNGLYTMSRKGADLIWSKVDRCIFLEDDQIPSVSYFKYCEELLEKYKDDLRVYAICAMNLAGVWEKSSSDYLFCDRGSIWGQATWRRAYELRDYDLNYAKDPYILNLLQKKVKNDKPFFKRVKGYANSKVFEGHTPGGEFLGRLAVCTQNQLFIVPKYNMMSNIGCTENGAHADEYNLMPRKIRRLFSMKTYEYDFPLKHPEYMIEDTEYLHFQEKAAGNDGAIFVFLRKIESLLLSIRYKGLNGVLKKLKKKILDRKKLET